MKVFLTVAMLFVCSPLFAQGGAIIALQVSGEGSVVAVEDPPVDELFSVYKLTNPPNAPGGEVLLYDYVAYTYVEVQTYVGGVPVIIRVLTEWCTKMDTPNQQQAMTGFTSTLVTLGADGPANYLAHGKGRWKHVDFSTTPPTTTLTGVWHTHDYLIDNPRN